MEAIRGFTGTKEVIVGVSITDDLKLIVRKEVFTYQDGILIEKAETEEAPIGESVG